MKLPKILRIVKVSCDDDNTKKTKLSLAQDGEVYIQSAELTKGYHLGKVSIHPENNRFYIFESKQDKKEQYLHFHDLEGLLIPEY